jgi:peptidoglycan hydrolase-like protein with peptidoglycan-binding domain
MLKLGSKGSDVLKMQKALKQAGYGGGGTDGVFGAKTKAAVRAYQKSHHLAVDGVVGKNTSGKLARNADGFDGVAKHKTRAPVSGTASASKAGSRGTGATGRNTDSMDTGATGATGSVRATPEMQRFAKIAEQTAIRMGTHGRCATGVNASINKTFGLNMHGNGNQVDNNLPKNKFKQLNISLEEALKTPGLVLTWEKTPTRLGSIYGHTAITLGDGKRSASDFVERNTLTSSAGRTGFKVFQPI